MPRKKSRLPVLTPRLVVRDAPAAIEYYVAALGARELERFADPRGHVVHAALDVGGAIVAITEEARAWHNHAPPSLGGSAVILILEVEDPDATARAMVERGGEVIFENADQPYGRREGRVRDPFGHVWIVGRQLRAMSAEEIAATLRD